MKVQGTIFAGIAVSIVTLASNNILHSVSNYEEETPDTTIQDSTSLDKINEKTQILEEKVTYLIQESKDKIEQYNDLYDSMYGTELRLSNKHITYGSRLVQDEDKFIKNNPVPYSHREQPISLDLRTPSAITAYEINEYLLKGTALSGLGQAFVQAELDHGVNALFLLSLAVHESGWGKSAIARDKNNLFGYRAYDSSPYKSATHFATKQEGINRVAKHLSETYLVDSGPYYSGGYTLTHVNKRYASDTNWSRKIAKTMDSFNREIMAKQDTGYHLEEYVIGEDSNGEPIYSHTFSAAVGQ